MIISSAFGGNDDFDGGDGIDTVDYSLDYQYGGNRGIIANLSASAVSASMGGVTTLVAASTILDGFGATDSVKNIEYVKGTQFADQFYGSDGNDVFAGLAGNDYLDGGKGSDTVDYSFDEEAGGKAGVVVNLSAQENAGPASPASPAAPPLVASQTALDGFGNVDTLLNIENVIGTNFGDIFFGSADNNKFAGLGGNDTIQGSDGIDTVDYSLDQAHGGSAGATVNLSDTDLSKARFGAANSAIDGFGNTDTLSGIENVISPSIATALSAQARTTSWKAAQATTS